MIAIRITGAGEASAGKIFSPKAYKQSNIWVTVNHELLRIDVAQVLKQIYCGIYSYNSRVRLPMLKPQSGAQIPNIPKTLYIWHTPWLIKSPGRPGMQEWIAHPKCSARLSEV